MHKVSEELETFPQRRKVPELLSVSICSLTRQYTASFLKNDFPLDEEAWTDFHRQRWPALVRDSAG